METVKSQYGIVGYNIIIVFKDGTKQMKYFVENGDDALNGINQLCEYCLGRAGNAELGSNCDCKPSGNTCNCGPGYMCVIIATAVIVVVYIAVSFVIAEVMWTQKVKNAISTGMSVTVSP